MPADAPRWIGEGLRFECTGCGDCCRGPGGYVYLGTDEIAGLAEHLEMDVDTFGRRYLRRHLTRLALVDSPGGDCVFLDDEGRCSVYEARPVQCRTYPWWPENLRGRGRWDMEATVCEGIGQGAVVPLGQIMEQLQRMKENG